MRETSYSFLTRDFCAPFTSAPGFVVLEYAYLRKFLPEFLTELEEYTIRSGPEDLYVECGMAEVCEAVRERMAAMPTPKRAIGVLKKVEVEGELDCIICLEIVREEATELPCEHHFHGECIATWLQQHRNCPCCRAGATTFAVGWNGKASAWRFRYENDLP